MIAHVKAIDRLS